jgi:hypothetical protein
MPTLEEDVEETAGVVLTHTAVLTTLIETMKHRGLISQADVNQILDLALVGLENSEAVRPPTFRAARRVMEEMIETMGGPRGG